MSKRSVSSATQQILACDALPSYSPRPNICTLNIYQVWRHASFKQRRLLLEVLLKYIITHQEDICRYATNPTIKEEKGVRI
jgi:hypothetical protein